MSQNRNRRRKPTGRGPERFNWASFIVGVVILGGMAAALLPIDTRTSAIECFVFGGIALALFAVVVTGPIRYRRRSRRSRDR